MVLRPQEKTLAKMVRGGLTEKVETDKVSCCSCTSTDQFWRVLMIRYSRCARLLARLNVNLPLMCRFCLRFTLFSGPLTHPGCLMLPTHVPRAQVVKLQFTNVGKLPPPVLQIDRVTFGYDKDHILYENVDLAVDLDSRVAIVGANGAWPACARGSITCFSCES